MVDAVLLVVDVAVLGEVLLVVVVVVLGEGLLVVDDVGVGVGVVVDVLDGVGLGQPWCHFAARAMDASVREAWWCLALGDCAPADGAAMANAAIGRARPAARVVLAVRESRAGVG